MSEILDIKDRSIRYTGPGCGYKYDVRHRSLDEAVTTAILDRLYIDYAPTARDRYLNIAGAAYWAAVADGIAARQELNRGARSLSA